MTDALDRQLRSEEGLSHEDYMILSQLHRTPGRRMRMSDLAKALSHSPSRSTHSVARLEEQGWVERVRGESDRRSVEACLTTSGVIKVAEASKSHLKTVHRLVFETLGADRVKEVGEAFDEIRRSAAAWGESD